MNLLILLAAWAGVSVICALVHTWKEKRDDR